MTVNVDAELSRVMPYDHKAPLQTCKLKFRKIETRSLHSVRTVIVPMSVAQLPSRFIRVNHTLRFSYGAGTVVLWSGPVASQIESRNRSFSKAVSLQNAFGFELRVIMGRWLGSRILCLSFMPWKMISGAYAIHWCFNVPGIMKIWIYSNLLGLAI